MNKIHLIQYLMPPVTHHSTATWKHPHNMMGGHFRFDRPEIWQHVVRLCEQAKYDAVFLADVEGLYSDWGASPAGAVQYGSQSICFEPTIVLTWMAAATSQLGMVMTLTTNSYPPYVGARKFATLDHLSAGRAGWNLVAAFHGDGFILSPLYLPGSIEEFASMVVPILQRRGLVRTAYIDGTLRDNLLAF